MDFRKHHIRKHENARNYFMFEGSNEVKISVSWHKILLTETSMQENESPIKVPIVTEVVLMTLFNFNFWVDFTKSSGVSIVNFEQDCDSCVIRMFYKTKI